MLNQVSIPFKRDGVSELDRMHGSPYAWVSKAQSQTRFKADVFARTGSAKKRKNPCPIFTINYTTNESEMSIFLNFSAA